jgi:hypothetical protein
MKIYFVLILYSFSLFASIPESTIDRLQKIYPDRDRQSLYDVIKNSKDPFQLWRAFPAYTYELMNRKFSGRILEKEGFCAGDAHAENFGFLYSSAINKTIFTINDLDDSANCRLEVDLLRLLAGNLFLTNNIDEQINSYLAGVRGESLNLELVKDLEQESVKKGSQLSKKYKQLLESGCTGEFSELNEPEISLIKSYMEKTSRKFLRACARVKENGGSAGLRRFIVFYDNEGKTSAIELKPLVSPAPLYNFSISRNERASIFKAAVELILGISYLNSYKPIVLNNQLFQERPRIAGNIGIEIKDFSNEKLKNILQLELHVLGLIHRKSNLDPATIDRVKVGQLAQELQHLFKKEFGIP